jgi:hypothetical protein
MVAKVFAFGPRKSAPSDWFQSELAELYRIENALLQSGLAVENDRGLTDEGDPWFVFCRPDGDVLVHLTRFDGLYRLYSPVLSTPLVGRSFVELTKAFTDQIPLQVVVQRARGARLYVHPASLLAVIVSTIFLAAQDVLPPQGTPEASKRGDDGGDAAAAHPLKASLQAMFQSHLDALVGWAKEGGSAQQTTYLGVIGTVAAVLTGLADALMQDSTNVTRADGEQTTQGSDVHQTHDDVVDIAKIDSAITHDSLAQQTRLSAPAEVHDQATQGAYDKQTTPVDHGFSIAATPSADRDANALGAGRSAVFQNKADSNSSINSDHSILTPDGSASDSGLSHWVVQVPLKSSPEVSTLTPASFSSSTPSVLSSSTPPVYSSPVLNDLLTSANLVSSSSSGLEQVNTLLSHATPVDSSSSSNVATSTSNNLIGGPSVPVPVPVPVAVPSPATFNAQAEVTLENFLNANPNAQAFFNENSMVIYETNSASHASNSVLNIWKFPDGSTITLVGTSDHHGTLV